VVLEHDRAGHSGQHHAQIVRIHDVREESWFTHFYVRSTSVCLMCLYITFAAGLNNIIIQARINLLLSRQQSYTSRTIDEVLRRRTGRSVPGMYSTYYSN
jgi:hypothetical protein